MSCHLVRSEQCQQFQNCDNFQQVPALQEQQQLRVDIWAQETDLNKSVWKAQLTMLVTEKTMT